MPWLFLLAYTLSGLAGLIYEVCWTRLLTLAIGHTTAAASAVVAAFLGGLAVGAGAGGRIATRLSARQCLPVYIGLELAVGAAALLLPFELKALLPLLKWAYSNGEPGMLFPLVRILACLVMVFVPALALGVTFPVAIRWFASGSSNTARSSGALYAANTTGAAIGAPLAGFVLIPTIGISGATWAGVAVSTVAAFLVWIVMRTDRKTDVEPVTALPTPIAPIASSTSARRRRLRQDTAIVEPPPIVDARWLASIVLGLSGFAALVHEITWTRILTLVLGPTIYAFSATLAAVIAGVALGSMAGTWIGSRTGHHAGWLAFTLALAALTTTATSALAGGYLPRLVAQQMADAPNLFDQLLRQGTLLTAALIVPTAASVGAAFPLGLTLVSSSSRDDAGRFSLVYAINTIGAVSGSLAAGFFFIPRLGLQSTLTLVSGCLIGAAILVLSWTRLTRTARLTGAVAAGAAAAMLVAAPPWDRELLASGVYLYAPDVPEGLDREALLKAGTLLYYREGAAATVSVRRLTGTTTLAVDGKVDASNRRDMLTQKLIAHLPLLLHGDPKDVAIIGLGSGVTLGAALHHPVARADVLEISPEVVEASEFFAADNNRALDDARARLIVGDGRSHLLLSDRKYDVIISEPSNPWIAGVAALFTQEFFLAARDRLAPGGLVCQWAHTYNISNADLRSIVATFRSVFPQGTAWLVGGDDVLLIASADPLDDRLANIARGWSRPAVAADLASMAVLEPFSILSLFAGGPAELTSYSGDAAILTDDRMTLEFSAPRELHQPEAAANSAALAAVLTPDAGPEIVRAAKSTAGAIQWRNRGAMLMKSDVYALAYDDFVRALQRDSTDQITLDGLVKTAVLTGRASDALGWIKAAMMNRPATVASLVATSQLLEAAKVSDEAIETGIQATRLSPVAPAALEQLASLYADRAHTTALDATVDTLRRIAPDRAPTFYYSAVLAFLRGDSEAAIALGDQAVATDPQYAPVYDLLGAAHTKLGNAARARNAFHTSLRLNPHDSTAYANLGVIELAAGNRSEAADYFAEALWLEPASQVARQGLQQAK